MEERTEEGTSEIDFIKNELIPEMVHNRCFCDPGSREFVELESIVSSKLQNPKNSGDYNLWRYYEAKAVIRFSGDPVTFHLIIKILSDPKIEKARDAFSKEETFYNKISKEYKLNCFLKCYTADMKSYGVPVIVLEDLRDYGYERIDGKLNEKQLKASLETLGGFHGRGLYFKYYKHELFKEFYSQLSETYDEDSTVPCSEKIARILQQLPNAELSKKLETRLGEDPVRTARTLMSEMKDVFAICHGHFSRDRLLFKQENEGGIDVRMIDWQTMRHCSLAVDLAPILFSNLPSGSCASKTQFLEEMLTCYLRALNRESNRDLPEITVDRLKREIVSKAFYAYVILSSDVASTDNELVETFIFLDSLGAFD